jgi:hypothetical protein
VLNVDMRSIETSPDFPEYETIRGSVVNGFAYYYRLNGGDWVYGYGGNGMMSCSEYTDTSVQKAFSDHACGDDDNQETTLKEYFEL